MTLAIFGHSECYRMLAALSSWAWISYARIRGCGIAIEQLPQDSTNRSAVAHVRTISPLISPLSLFVTSKFSGLVVRVDPATAGESQSYRMLLH
jgi:hypothetical protein